MMMSSKKQMGAGAKYPLSPEELQIAIGLDTGLLNWGIKDIVTLYPFKPPHIAVLGNSGSGKSYLTTKLMGYISLHKECELVLSEFKGIDFQWLCGSRNFYQHLDVGIGLDYVYNRMNERMSSGKPVEYMHPIFFFCDEWSGYLSMLEKKEADIQKKKLSALLMLGRGVSVCCVLALQRADAEYFQRARDNIGNIILMGSPSEESKRMSAPDYKDRLEPQPCGKGYLLTDGKPLRPITVSKVKDMEKLHSTIKAALNRSFE